MWRERKLGRSWGSLAQRRSSSPEPSEGAAEIWRIVCHYVVTVLFIFFQMKKQNKGLCDLNPEGRWTSRTLCKLLWWQAPLSSCKRTSQNNGPLLKCQKWPPKPHLPPSSLCLKFFPNPASICSHYLIPHVPTGVNLTGIFQPFHFTSASYKARAEPAALQQATG